MIIRRRYGNMTTYENNFIDWELRLIKAGTEGFLYKSYSSIINYFTIKHPMFVNTFMNYTKLEKRVWCAQLVYYHTDDKKLKNKAFKYLCKKEGKTKLW